MQNTVKVGKVELPLASGKSPHVPQGAIDFIDHDGILNTLAIGIRDNLPVILIGETGTGKTSAVRHLAQLTHNGLRRVNLNGSTTADELVGHLLLNEKGTVWTDGVLTQAMRNGEWIVLDEINAALPEVLFVLQSIMDDDGYLVLVGKEDKEIVRKHPNFRIFATCNPPNYAGTKEMNRALLSRFPICIDATYPDEKTERAVIERHMGKDVAKLEITDAIIKIANDTRKTYKEGKSDFAIGTRDILNFLRLSKYMSPRRALEAAFIGKLSTSEEQNAVRAMARIDLPADKAEGVTLEHITSMDKQFLVGGTFKLDADVSNIYGSIQRKTKTAIDNLSKQNAGVSIQQGTSHAVKGETFKLLGIFRHGSLGVVTDPNDVSPIIAALVEFKSGTHKGKIGVIRTDIPEVTQALYAQC